MTTGIVTLPIRSSPTLRSIHRGGSGHPIHAAVRHRSTSSAASIMFRRAAERPPPPPPPRSTLEKTLFPSSSPSPSTHGDIRDQLRTPGRPVAASVSVSTSARMAPSRPTTLTSWSANSTLPPNRASLHSLYTNSDSFKQEIDCVDLAAPAPLAQKKAEEVVYFAEDDFSDDDNLDLDYEAPKALPTPRVLVQEAPVKQQMPPPPTPSQADSAIPWSSSPASHFVAPTLPNPPPSRPDPSASTRSSVKRESSGETDVCEAPVPKKPKKRVLPAGFRSQDAPEPDEGYCVSTATPDTKSHYWDPTGSIVQEQKRQLKNQRNSRQPEHDAPPDDASNAGPALVPKAVPLSLSAEQNQVLDLVVHKNASVFFTGPAGTGKSVLMRAIISELKKKFAREPDRVAVTASTGLAACNIGGITLHSFSGIGLGKEDAPALIKKVRRNPKAKARWLKVKCLIIDEVSMVDGELFDKLSQIGRVIRNNGRPWGGIQLIITGDFFQLPPVPDFDKKREGIKFAFDAATWGTSIDHTIGLTQVFRQRDPEFARMLNEMRLGKISQGTVEAFKALSRPLSFDDGVDSAELYPTRAQVDSSNEKRLRELPGRSYRYDALDSGEPAIRDKLLTNMMAPRSLELKLNAQVMLIKNLDETLVNGTLGKVIAFSDEKTFDMTSVSAYDTDMDDPMSMARRKLKGFSRDANISDSNKKKYPVVQFVSSGGSPRVILCQPEEWKVELPNGDIQAKRNQLPLILAWALSIHKAQGQTLERVTVNLGRVFEKGQAYVALSRATTQQGLRVLGFDQSKVMAHHRVVDFYSKLYSADQAQGQPTPTGIMDFVANRRGVREPKAAAPVVAVAAPSKPTQTTPSMRVEVIDLDEDEEAMASYGY
ncbi:mitochondrial DNA helicase [Drechmeria coniospora]|uniref:ATP-dependent DNA helicase PIF1 n=1 Tax=Drechmeria coniospora TaxID=98403 RepID=A0A151GWK7_DRECN|nr:mitochondrial DNA helicase [Drechmeria coniospora]KYK61412.1 mitochondrial DNA helicase [Drechmeria coniospora]ODA81175.1 hypothetical protein RJ55_04139 [Drechmeria coniospora]